LTLQEIKDEIDACFVEGYAKDHPELVGQCLLAYTIHGIDETLASTIQAVIKHGLFKFFR